LASIVVELANRVPRRMLHASFSIVDIGTDGRLDVARLNCAADRKRSINPVLARSAVV
jgi:hypothetical protein